MISKEEREEIQLHIKHIQEAEKHTEWVAWTSLVISILVVIVQAFK